MPRPEPPGEPVVLHIERLPGDPAAGEVLAVDRPARRGWRRATTVWVAAAALVVGGLLADRAQRDREIEQLVDDVERATAAVALAETRAVLMQVYVRPVSSAGVTGGALTDDLEAVVRDAEVTGADELAEQARRLDAATVLPWHTDLVESREVLQQFVSRHERRLRGTGDDEAPSVQEVADAVRAVVPEGPQADRLETVLDGIPRVRD